MLQNFAVCIKCEEKTMPINHFHFRCRNCETIECLPEAVHFSAPDGYNAESVNRVLTGVKDLYHKTLPVNAQGQYHIL